MTDYPLVANAALVDPAQAQRFMAALYRHVEWDDEIISLLGVGEKGTAREGVLRERVFINPDAAGTVPLHLGRWAQHHGGSFIVPCVVKAAARDEKDVKLDKISAMVAIILDLDSGDVDAKIEFVSTRLGKPSMIVRSGGKTETGAEKRHLYWLFSEPSEEIDRVAALRKLLAQKVGGDPSFGRATQVIRLPGSVHAKNGNASLCQLVEENALEYDLDDLAEIIEGMAPMPGLPEPKPTSAVLPFGENGGMDFSIGAGLEVQTALAAMAQDIHEGGDEDRSRWTSFNQVAGFNIQQVRLNQMTVDEAIAATRGWMLTHMVPPWPDDRFITEFNALYNKDVMTHGEMPHIVAQQQEVAAVVAAGAISATPFVWRDPATIPLRPWVFGRWLLRNTVTAIVAPGGVGKSSLVASMMLSLASGRSLLGKDVWGGAQRAWYWNLEDDGDELARQMHAAAIHHGIRKADVDGRLFIDSGPDGSGLCTAVEDRSGFTLRRPVTDALIVELKERGIDVLVVDPFVSSHEVDENANSKIDAVVKEWARVAKAANCSIGLVHHTKKLEGRKVTGESSRGATSLINAARSVLVLNRMDAEQGDFFGIPAVDHGRYFNVQDDKHNRAPAEAAQWYTLASTPLGNGDSVGVVTPWQPPSALDGVTPDHLAQVQAVLRGGKYRKDVQAADWAGRVVAKICNMDLEDAGVKRRIGQILKRWISDGFVEEYQAEDAKRMQRTYLRAATVIPTLTVVPSDDDD